MNNQKNPLAQDFSLLSLLKFAFPTITMMMFMGLYTIVDTIFVSQFVSTYALSAINIVCPIINIIVGLATMLATGGNAIIARKMGQGDIKRANQDFTLIVIVGFIIGVLIMLLGISFLDKIIWCLGASQILFQYCQDYLFIILLFTPASILQVLFQNLIVTAGQPTFGMIISLMAGTINVVLDYIFIVLFDMGIRGSALGTVIGYIIPSVIGILFFASKKGSLYFEKPNIDFLVIIKSCINGFSEMVSQISTALTTFFFNLTMMKSLGEKGVGSITIIIYTQFLLTTLYIGFSMGVAPIISFHYGAKDNCLKKVYNICLYSIILSSIFVFMFIMLFNHILVGFFVDKNKEVYTLTTIGLTIFKYSFLFSGINIFTSATFTALSNGKVSAIISFLRTFGFIMMGLLMLPELFGVNGVWLAVPIAEFLTFIISLFFIIKYKKGYQYI